MGLYRNIAGFLDNRQVGLSLYQPQLTIMDTGSSSFIPSPFNDPAAFQQQLQATHDATVAAYKANYDFLMNTPNSQLFPGYFIDTNGSVFQGTPESGIAFLGIQDIQSIENAAGTAGALMLKLNQPEIAKETAGYAGGNTATSVATDPNVSDPTVYVVSTPIPAVQTLPPTTTATTPVTSTTPGYVTPGATTTTTQPLAPATAPKNNFLPLALLAGLAAVAVAGEPMLHNKRKVVYVGGLAALYYLMSKRT